MSGGVAALERFLSEKRAGSLSMRTESLKQRAALFSYDAMFKKIIDCVKAQLVEMES